MMCQVMKNFQKCLKPQFHVEKDSRIQGLLRVFISECQGGR
jgi:hypothetical protein